MPRFMTMNGHQTVATAPLDLRTTTRERGGSGGDRSPGDKGRSRDIVELSVESPAAPRTAASNLGNGKSPTAEVQEDPCGSSFVKPPTNIGNAAVPDTKHSPLEHCPRLDPHSPKCAANSSNTATTDEHTQSSLKLPFRKRRFPVAWESPGQSQIPLGREERLSTEETTELIRRPPKVLKRDEPDGRGCLVPVAPRRLSAASGFEERQQSPLQSFNHYCRHPGYSVYHWPHMSPNMAPVIVNIPVPHTIHPSEQAEHLLADVALATHQDDDGDTALHIAVVQGQEALVNTLIHLLRLAHKDLDIYNNLRQTPLHLAVITHQARLVELVLRAGADPGALDRHGQTAIHLCCEHGQQACLSVVLSPSRSPSPSSYLEIRNYEGLTPLHLAVQGGHQELARLLIDAGADINAMDIKSGQSPLIHAVENNNTEMVHFLIENGCDVNGQSYSGNTALHSACGRGQVDTARFLLKSGADSSLKNYHNDTPVMVAKNKRVTDVLRGKGPRNQNPKSQEQQCEPASPHRGIPYSQTRVNGSPSSNHSLGRSPSTTPLPPHHHSPRAPPTPSPHNQSTDSMSGHQSPIETQEREPLPMMGSSNMTAADIRLIQRGAVSLPFYPQVMHHSPMADTRMSGFYSPGAQRLLYPESPVILLPTNLSQPASIIPTSQMTFGESRPSSRCSNQSDVSTMSVSSGGKGES